MNDLTGNHPQPPMQSRPIDPPGFTSEMPQKPDHGEKSYTGSGRLAGRAAVSRAPTAASAAPSRSPSPGKARTC